MILVLARFDRVPELRPARIDVDPKLSPQEEIINQNFKKRLKENGFLIIFHIQPLGAPITPNCANNSEGL